MYRTLEKALVPVVQNVLINVERPLVLPTKIAPSPVYDADGSQGLQLHLSENLQVQATTSTMNDEEETTGIHVTHERIVKPLVHAP
ncbi:hypothetical protein QN277_023321 [Acacia crassicarpa]|uniref:Uncharacterized protein n=1 Tax=Acacia crassicarpa TaxID=499986 RepID=A0AAE1MQJ1_9FABA|nr:hypothetical protein QN277_023321 [Acacia crassicarpa]